MKTALIPPVLLALVTLMPANAAAHCFDYGTAGTGVWQFTDGTPEHTAYVDDHDYAFGEGIWILLESNGVWEPKLPGVYHAAHWWSQPDMQFTDCGIIVPVDCGYHWCPEMSAYETGPDTLLF